MANRGNDWNSFMQSRYAQLVLNGFCTIITAFYAVDAVREMLSPERSAVLMQQVGPTMYYVLTVARTLVCVWVSFIFGRMTYKVYLKKDDDEQ
ncbi:MAG: hypothetical protein Q4G41_08080 [Coriobacteriales bacterium]|nr:hypothetical protein [Coriobacteriales bacterium]MDO5710061.1 hypothetical protein [Coriobacteriales bacterium]